MDDFKIYAINHYYEKRLAEALTSRHPARLQAEQTTTLSYMICSLGSDLGKNGERTFDELKYSTKR